MKIGYEAARQPVRQELVDQRKGCIFARKSVDHKAPRAEHASTIREERPIVADMLDDGAR